MPHQTNRLQFSLHVKTSLNLSHSHAKANLLLQNAHKIVNIVYRSKQGAKVTKRMFYLTSLRIQIRNEISTVAIGLSCPHLNKRPKSLLG